MRAHVRTVLALALVIALLALFLYNVDLRRVASEILRARPQWLALSVATVFANLIIRSWRWQFLLEPLGRPTFGSSFRATAVGFAATSMLPARAGEVIRPYFLARTERGNERMTATGAFATIIVERVLDTITVLLLLASFVFFFGREHSSSSPTAFTAVKWAGAIAGLGASGTLIVLFVLARDPSRLGRLMMRLAKVVPSALAGLIAKVAEKFAQGLGAVRRPGRLLWSLVLSLPLWLSICLGVWSVTRAFGFDVPFTGSFLLVAILVLGVAVPTPGAVGGFHEAFRVATTVFFAVPDDAAVAAAIVLHLLSIGPVVLLGLLFAAQAGLNVSSMRRLADEPHPGHSA
jgi:glycosyltransferase 2 family protein